MQITGVRVFPVREEKLKAFVSVIFDGCFMVNDIKVIQGREGLFISMPSRRKRNGDYKDVAHPLNNETRGRLEEAILAEYDRVSNGLPDEGMAPPMEPTELSDQTRVESPVLGEGPALEEDKSLEEVEELHLRDSFWSVS